MNVKIEPSWHEHLQQEFEQPYFAQLTDFVRQEYTTQTCYPPGSLIFNAFNLCPFDKVKVVIIGQDPYHRCRRSAFSAVIAEHLQGDTERPGQADSCFGRPYPLG